MLITVAELRNRIYTDMDMLVDELQSITYRSNFARKDWLSKQCLLVIPKVCRV